jgi:hypothetical protein
MKIAICTPHYGGVTMEYAQSLSRMIICTLRTTIVWNGVEVEPEIEVFTTSSSILPWARNSLVEDAVRWGADYLLWVDADQRFPVDALLRLLTLGFPIVGANYPRRGEPVWPTAIGLDGKRVITTKALADSGQVVEVASLGLGFCLVTMSVIHALREELTDGEREPLFAYQWFSGGLELAGEDVFFFRRARKAGFAVHMDHALSWHMGHSYNKVLTHADVDSGRVDEWPP